MVERGMVRGVRKLVGMDLPLTRYKGSASSQEVTDALKDTLSDTDEPSLESRVADNLMVALWVYGLIPVLLDLPLGKIRIWSNRRIVKTIERCRAWVLRCQFKCNAQALVMVVILLCTVHKTCRVSSLRLYRLLLERDLE